ncbi:unnamed protein product [Victoria cruziana]
MWRHVFRLRGPSTIVARSMPAAPPRTSVFPPPTHLLFRPAFFTSGGSPSSSSSSCPPEEHPDSAPISLAEAKKLLRLVNVESLKKRLEMEGREVIDYSLLLKECESIGVAKSAEEAVALAKVLDEAGVVLLFRDKVYLHPDKVAELVSRAMPLALAPADDPRREELKKLHKMKEDIDMLAHRQVRRILWTGLGFFVLQGSDIPRSHEEAFSVTSEKDFEEAKL